MTDQESPDIRLSDWDDAPLVLVSSPKKKENNKDGELSLGNPDLTTPAAGRRTAPRDYMV